MPQLACQVSQRSQGPASLKLTVFRRGYTRDARGTLTRGGTLVYTAPRELGGNVQGVHSIVSTGRRTCSIGLRPGDFDHSIGLASLVPGIGLWALQSGELSFVLVVPLSWARGACRVSRGCPD